MSLNFPPCISAVHLKQNLHRKSCVLTLLACPTLLLFIFISSDLYYVQSEVSYKSLFSSSENDNGTRPERFLLQLGSIFCALK